MLSLLLAATEIIVAPAVGTRDELVIEGRVLSHHPHSDEPFWNNVGALLAPTRGGVTVSATFAGLGAEAASDESGDFSITLRSAARFAAGRSLAAVRVHDVSIRLPVQITDDAPSFMVISDFDDTVAVSNVIDPGGLARTALLLDGQTHPPVPLMSEFYRCLLDKPVRPALLFVSGSPIQYAPRLIDFLQKNHFPFAGLYLRRLSPQTLRGYKQPVIRRLLARFPSPVIFVGDSGEHDPEVYAEIRREAGSRVLQTYIRDAGHSEDNARFVGAMLFRNPEEAIEDARSRGFVSPNCR